MLVHWWHLTGESYLQVRGRWDSQVGFAFLLAVRVSPMLCWRTSAPADAAASGLAVGIGCELQKTLEGRKGVSWP